MIYDAWKLESGMDTGLDGLLFQKKIDIIIILSKRACIAIIITDYYLLMCWVLVWCCWS